MPTEDTNALLKSAGDGISKYLAEARHSGRIDEGSYHQAVQNTVPNLKDWLTDEHLPAISPGLRAGLHEAIRKGEWEKLVNAFRERARFGTGGIRGMMAFDRPSIERLKQEGLAAPILRGPNTINDAVLLLTSAGVAKFGRDQSPSFDKMVIGYDSRIRGFDFARIVAELFLAYGYTVYFFDEPVPYPEMTFAIPYRGIKADLGILISASHNDYRYNGYKLSCSNGSQFDPEERNTMYDKYIAHATTADVRLCPFQDAAPDKLVFLGGDERVEGFNYYGHEKQVLNIHREHGNHVRSFVLSKDLAAEERAATNPLRIAYCAFHGAGRRAVPRLLAEVGFPVDNVTRITEGGLDNLDGLFPSFRSDPGHEQQPDPGDPRAARTAVEAFKKQVGTVPIIAPAEGTVPIFAPAKMGLSPYGSWGYDDMDILVGTDPDADRCGVVVKVPADQRSLYGGQDWTLLPADSMWALLLWYRLNREIEEHGHVLEPEKKFIVLSHTTSDSIVLLARKHGIGVVKTWVGFAALAAAVRDVWERRPLPPLVEARESPQSPLCHPFVCESLDMERGRRSINIAAMEQSNGYSILGGPPPDRRSLGVGGHVRDKDGTLAALLTAEVAAWAKRHGTTLYELIDRHVFLDPAVGLFVNYYEPDPIDGEYPGIEGDRKKMEILRRALGYFQFGATGDLEIAGRRATSAVIYRTGKYDKIYRPTYAFQFPDEGVRFYFGDPLNHLTVRPSGTGNSLRFHIQLHEPVTESNLIEKKRELFTAAKAMADHLREILKAPRSS